MSALAMFTLSIVQAVRKNSDDKIIYIKKYQKWLLEEKNISYKPKFAKKQMQETFDSINLEKIAF